MKHHVRHLDRSFSSTFPAAGRAALTPRFRPGPNRRRGGWSPPVRLALFGLVLLILALFALYRAMADYYAPPVPEPEPPRVQFRSEAPALRVISSGGWA